MAVGTWSRRRKQDAPAGESRASSTSDSYLNWSDEQQFFMLHRALYSRHALATIVVMGFSLTVILPAGVVYGLIDASTSLPCSYAPGEIYIGSSLVFTLLILTVFAVLIRNLDEGFFYREELIISAVGLIVGVVVFVVFSFVDTSFDVNTFPIRTIATLFVIVFLWIASTVMPILHSFRAIAGEHPPGPHPLRTLTGVLRDAEGLELFRRHLQREFALENLVFWQSVEDFRSLVTDMEDPFLRHQIALEIYDHCIRGGAVYEINIPFHLRERIKATLFRVTPGGGRTPGGPPTSRSKRGSHDESAGDEDADLAVSPGFSTPGRDAEPSHRSGDDALPEISPSFFDEAQQCIYDLLEKDSYLRFVITDEYKEFITRRASEPIKHRSSSRVLQVKDDNPFAPQETPSSRFSVAPPSSGPSPGSSGVKPDARLRTPTDSMNISQSHEVGAAVSTADRSTQHTMSSSSSSRSPLLAHGDSISVLQNFLAVQPADEAARSRTSTDRKLTAGQRNYSVSRSESELNRMVSAEDVSISPLSRQPSGDDIPLARLGSQDDSALGVGRPAPVTE